MRDIAAQRGILEAEAFHLSSKTKSTSVFLFCILGICLVIVLHFTIKWLRFSNDCFLIVEYLKQGKPKQNSRGWHYFNSILGVTPPENIFLFALILFLLSSCRCLHNKEQIACTVLPLVFIFTSLTWAVSYVIKYSLIQNLSFSWLGMISP